MDDKLSTDFTHQLDAIVQEWLQAYREHHFSALDLRKFWASRVPGLFKIPMGENSSTHKFDQPQIDKLLFSPLDQFITASPNPTAILNSLNDQNSPLHVLAEDLKGRFEIVARTIMNYSIELLCSENYVELPKDLGSEEAANLDFHASVLFNDEIHTFEEVISSLVRALPCVARDAKEFAQMVDSEGRATVKVGNFEECKKVKEIIERTTTRSQSRPIKCEVIQMLVFAHQEHVIQLFAWLNRIIGYHKDVRLVFSQVMLEEVNVLESLMINDVNLWKTARTRVHTLLAHGLLQNETEKFFAKSFIKLYDQLMQNHINDSHHVSYSIIQLGMEVYSVPSLAHSIIEEDDALHLFAKCFYKECDKYAVDGKLTIKPDQMNTFYRAQAVLTDLSCLLSTTPTNWTEKLRKSFLHGFETIITILKLMEDMDSITRKVSPHFDLDLGLEWKFSIYLQQEMASVVTPLLQWCSSDAQVLRESVKIALKHLREKTGEVNHKSWKLCEITCSCIDYDVSSLPVSIYVPLSRAIVGLLLELSKQNVDYASLDSPLSLIELMEMPMRVLAMFSQFRAGMWLRNLSWFKLIPFYYDPIWRKEMLDKDIVMMQYAASLIDPDEYLIHLLNKFNLMFWVQENYENNQDQDSIGQTSALAGEFLNLLLIIVSDRHTPGISKCTPEDKFRKEIVQWLGIKPCTLNDLRKKMSSQYKDESMIKELIKGMAALKRPTDANSKNEEYELKEQFYKDFSQFFYHYTPTEQRLAHKVQLTRKLQKGDKLIACPPPVPPELTEQFKPLRNILVCRVFMHIVKVVLGRVGDENDRSLSEYLYEKTLHLIGVALHEERRDLEKSEITEKFTEKFSFTKVAEQNDLLMPLKRCAQSARVESHKNLTDWLLQLFEDTVEVRNAADEKALEEEWVFL